MNRTCHNMQLLNDSTKIPKWQQNQMGKRNCHSDCDKLSNKYKITTNDKIL